MAVYPKHVCVTLPEQLIPLVQLSMHSQYRLFTMVFLTEKNLVGLFHYLITRAKYIINNVIMASKVIESLMLKLAFSS